MLLIPSAVQSLTVMHTVYYAVQDDSNFCLWLKSYSVTIQMKAIEQYFPMVLFIMLCKMILTFESVVEILKCVKGGSNF